MKSVRFVLWSMCVIVWLAGANGCKPRVDAYDLATGEAITRHADGTESRSVGYSQYCNPQYCIPGNPRAPLIVDMEVIRKLPVLQEIFAIFDDEEYDAEEKYIFANAFYGMYREHGTDERYLGMILSMIRYRHKEYMARAAERKQWKKVPEFVAADFSAQLNGEYAVDFLRLRKQFPEFATFQAQLPAEFRDRIPPSVWGGDRFVLGFDNGRLATVTIERTVQKSSCEQFFDLAADMPPETHCTERTILTFEGERTRVEQWLDGKLFGRGSFLHAEILPDSNPSGYSTFRELRQHSPDPADGVFERFYDNGQLAAIATVERGRFCGEMKYFGRTGELQSTYDYRDAEKIVSQSYVRLPNGEVKVRHRALTERSFVNTSDRSRWPKEEYDWEYYPDGRLQMESLKRKDAEGYVRRFHPNGQLALEEPLFYNNRQGVLREYDPEGHLIHEANWENGQLSGEERFYDAAGQLRESVAWVNYKREGISRRYTTDESGVVTEYTTPYEFNVPHGVAEVRSGGKLRKRIHYFMGVKHGVEEGWSGTDFQPFRNHYYYGSSLEKNREPELSLKTRANFKIYCGTPYRNMLPLRTLLERLGKDVPKLQDEFGLLYVDGKFELATEAAEVAAKTAAKVTDLRMVLLGGDAASGFFRAEVPGGGQLPEEWESREVTRELLFPERATESPSPYVFYLRNRGRLYQVTLNRQWSLPFGVLQEFYVLVELTEIVNLSAKYK